jgi:hypothetical protein
MHNIYLARKGDAVVHHTSKTEMKRLDGLTPELTVSEAEWQAAGGLARIIDGSIVIGKTDEEKAVEEQAAKDAARLAWLREYLAATDYIVIKIAEGAATASQYADEIKQRQAWRKEADDLVAKEHST